MKTLPPIASAVSSATRAAPVPRASRIAPIGVLLVVTAYFAFWALPVAHTSLDAAYVAFWAGPFLFTGALVWGWRALRQARSAGRRDVARLAVIGNVAASMALVFALTAWATMAWITYAPQYL